MQHRRDLLAGVGAAASAALAGCLGGLTGGSDGDSPTETVGPETAVAAQLNVYRARLYDAVALGRAGESEVGAEVAGSAFERFEGAGGEYGAHEVLEETDGDAYEGFEGALGDLRAALEEADPDAAADAADEAAGHLRTVQAALAGEGTRRALDALWVGSRAADAGVLARADDPFAGRTVANETRSALEGEVGDAVETADEDAAADLEAALEAIGDADGADAVHDGVESALAAAVDAAYAAADERAAGAAHLAALQARGYDADALARLGGPGEDLAHAGTLSAYRARLHDAGWLADAGATDAAAAAVEGVFADFEAAAAHDALEDADGDAYEAFEDGLDELASAIDEDGDVAGALATVDDPLRTGIEALAGAHAPVVQAGFVRARLADARERYERGEAGAAAAIASGVFERFEADELGFHEALEETDESLYETFEHEHLEALIEAYEAEDAGAVETHHEGALGALVEFGATRAPGVASAAEAVVAVARAFDAAALDALDAPERGAAAVEGAFEAFEADRGGFHEALEEADHDVYETYEEDLGAVRAAAAEGGDVLAAARAFGSTADEAVLAVAGSGAGDLGGEASAVVGEVFETFETARVHETLEEADHDAYEAFEGALNEYASGLEAGGGAVEPVADATLRAQFAVVGAVEDAPVGEAGEGEGEEHADLSGGPNVVEGVPEDADHVVELHAVAFEPEELTVSVGDTVAFEHVEGEPHNVVAYEDDLPEGADYWASGGFESEAAAREGWDEGEGAVVEGQSYVRTFETPGTHAYYCVPHEAAGMVGEVVVEE